MGLQYSPEKETCLLNFQWIGKNSEIIWKCSFQKDLQNEVILEKSSHSLSLSLSPTSFIYETAERNLVLAVYTNSCTPNSILVFYITRERSCVFPSNKNLVHQMPITSIGTWSPPSDLIYENFWRRKTTPSKYFTWWLRVNPVIYEEKSAIWHKIWICLWTKEIYEASHLKANSLLQNTLYGARGFIIAFSLSNKISIWGILNDMKKMFSESEQ